MSPKRTYRNGSKNVISSTDAEGLRSGNNEVDLRLKTTLPGKRSPKQRSM